MGDPYVDMRDAIFQLKMKLSTIGCDDEEDEEDEDEDDEEDA